MITVTTGNPINSTSITRLAFRNRFTFAEKVAIETAAETSADLRVLLKDLEAASFIDLLRTDAIGGMQVLESMGILATGRATEIMDTTTITDDERPLR